MLFFTPLSQSWRSLKANRNYNIINILGLSLGLASTFILFKIILSEWNTDRFHHQYDQICYSTRQTNLLGDAHIAKAHVFGIDYSEVPEVKYGTTIVFEPNSELTVGTNVYQVPVVEIDSQFMLVFDFPLLQGSYQNLLKNPQGIILSRTLSVKLFGTEPSMGKPLGFRDDIYKVEGILDDFPGNSTLQIDAMVFHVIRGSYLHPAAEFIVLSGPGLLGTVNQKFKALHEANPRKRDTDVVYKPMKDLYFNQNGEGFQDVMKFGNIKYLKILLLIAVMLFSVSTFNYLNIYQVSLQKRAQEIGILCIHGGGRRYLSGLFLKENLLSVAISAILVVLIYSLLSPYAPLLMERSLPVNPSTDFLLLMAISLLMILATSVITAWRFRRINPLFYIRELSTGKRAMLSRRISMTIQYGVTIVLIIITIFFVRQLNYLMSLDMGFKQNNIICAPFFSRVEYGWGNDRTDEEEEKAKAVLYQKIAAQRSNFQFVMDEIGKNPYLQNLSFGHTPLDLGMMAWRNRDSDQEYSDVFCCFLTLGFKELYGLKLTEGRFFDLERDQSREQKVVINQAAKHLFDIKDISTAYLANTSWGGVKEPWKVIGVVEDFSFEHLSMGIKPLLLFYFDDKTNNDLMVGITPGKEAESVEFLKALFTQVNPGKVFSYHFVEDDVAKLYADDKKLVRVYSTFTIIALIISSLGLFSFSIYDIQQRFREIGIRRVNGSGIWEIVFYLTKHILVLLAIAFVIAVPVAWYGILKYLEGFANKAPVSWWIFVLAGLFTLVISILTVIWQSYRAASRNPVEALRYE